MNASTLSYPGDLGWTIGVLMRAYQKRTDVLVAHLPAGPRGFALLSTVIHHDPPSQLALAGRLGIDPTVMTYLIDTLADAGLVERRQDPNDRRARRIIATEAGRTALAECERGIEAAEQEFLETLPAGERTGFVRLICQFATGLRTIDPSLDPCEAVETPRAGSSSPAPSSRGRTRK